jgi:cytoskeletal protein RodZ
MIKDNIKLGYILNKYRLKSKLDINQIADKISTNVDYIIALEKGSYKVFQTLNQAIPIIRKLSYVLGLKYQILIELYTREYEVYWDLQKQKSSIPKLVINNNLVRLSFSFSILGIIVGYLILQVYQIRYSPAITLANENIHQIYNENQYKLEGKLTRADNLTLNGQKVTIKGDGKFEVLLNLEKGENRIELSVKKDNQVLKTIQKIIYKE